MNMWLEDYMDEAIDDIVVELEATTLSEPEDVSDRFAILWLLLCRV